MQEQTEETHEEFPYIYDLMYNFRIKVCVTKALSDFLLDPNLINKENDNNSKEYKLWPSVASAMSHY